jgi:hypothetical protein
MKYKFPRKQRKELKDHTHFRTFGAVVLTLPGHQGIAGKIYCRYAPHAKTWHLQPQFYAGPLAQAINKAWAEDNAKRPGVMNSIHIKASSLSGCVAKLLMAFFPAASLRKQFNKPQQVTLAEHLEGFLDMVAIEKFGYKIHNIL